jgi:hypothetical protein
MESLVYNRWRGLLSYSPMCKYPSIAELPSILKKIKLQVIIPVEIFGAKLLDGSVV